MDLIDQYQVHGRTGGGGADRVGHIGQVRRARCGQPEEPGELHRHHPRRRRRRDRDVDDRQPMEILRVPLAGGQLVGAAELAERGGLASARRAADDGAAAGGDLVPVELDQQPAGADDLPDNRGVHQRQARVVVDPRLVVPGPCRRIQAGQCRAVQQGRRGRLPVHEAPPSLLGGWRGISGELATVVQFPGGRRGQRGGHDGHLSASARASKMPSGITSAIASPASSASP